MYKATENKHARHPDIDMMMNLGERGREQERLLGHMCVYVQEKDRMAGENRFI
jgi:hypothetical protein